MPAIPVERLGASCFALLETEGGCPVSDGTTQELAKMARETAGRGRYAIATYVAIAIIGLTFGSVCTASTITSADSLQAHSRSDVRTQELTTIARETAGRSRGAIIAYGVFLIL